MGAAAGAAAGARRNKDRDRVNSDEWEADGLTRGGGSGFFVVGGKKRDSSQAWHQRRASATSSIGRGTPRSARSSLRAIPPSASNGAGQPSKNKGLLAGLFGGGMLLGKALNKPHTRSPVPTNDVDDHHSPEDDDPDDTANFSNLGPGARNDEKRGLMGAAGAGAAASATNDPFSDTATDHDSVSDEGHPEMRQVGGGGQGHSGSGWGGWGLAGLGAGSAAYAAAHRRNDSHATNDTAGDDTSDEDHYDDPMSPVHGGPPSSVATAGGGRDDRHLSNLSSLGGGAFSDDHGAESAATPSATVVTRGAGSGSGSGSGPRQDPFSDSSGPSSAGTSLPPPPRAARDRRGSSPNTYGNLAPAADSSSQPRIPSFHGGFGNGDLGLESSPERRESEGTEDSHDVNPALLGAAAGGLGALAAGHRDSGGSTYSKGRYPSGLPEGNNSNNPSGDSLSNQRHSKFISAGTNLLGPGAAGGSNAGSRESLQRSSGSGSGSNGNEDSSPGGQPQEQLAEGRPQGQARRLPTIDSVSEFGERQDSSSTVAAGGAAAAAAAAAGAQGSLGSSGDGSRGSRGERSGASFVTSPERNSISQQRVSEEAGDGYYDRPSTDADPHRRSGLSHTSGFTSPGPAGADVDDGRQEGIAEAAAAGGLLGGLSAGWRRLTMGMTPGPAYRSEDGHSPQITQERRDSETLPSDQSPPLSQGPIGSQAQRGEPGLPSDVRSQHASVHGGLSAAPSVAHHHSSREQSGSSGDAPVRQPTQRSAQTASSSEPSSSSAEHGAGYAASVSNSSSSGTRSSASRGGTGLRYNASGRSGSSQSTGVDSASWRAQGSSSGSSGVGRGYSSRSNHTSEGSGGSTDAASYSPSNLNRQNTQSTRGGVSSISGRAAYTGRRRASQNDGGSSFADDNADDLEDDEVSEYYGDGQSSQATAGGDGSTRHARSDMSSNDSSSIAHPYAYGTAGGAADVRRLSSVREGPEDDAQSQTPSRGLGEFDEEAFRHYPTSTFGVSAGMMGGREDSNATIRTGGLPASLVPGLASPATTAEVDTSNASWRQSPRVESLSRRAAAAAADQQQPAQAGAVDLPVVAEDPAQEEHQEVPPGGEQRRSAWNIFR